MRSDSSESFDPLVSPMTYPLVSPIVLLNCVYRIVLNHIYEHTTYKNTQPEILCVEKFVPPCQEQFRPLDHTESLNHKKKLIQSNDSNALDIEALPLFVFLAQRTSCQNTQILSS